MCIDGMSGSRDHKVGGSRGCFRVKEWLNSSCLVDGCATITSAKNQVVLPENHIDRTRKGQGRSHDRAQSEHFTDAVGLLVRNRGLED